jgi:hypothetical protein
MKGLFLLAQEAPKSWLASSGRYSFEPYHYGPFSADIYRDIDSLCGMGFAQCHEVPGQTWCRYSLTDAGRSEASASTVDENPGLVKYIRDLRGWVTSLSFNRLLTAVYEKYPEFARNSVFNRSWVILGHSLQPTGTAQLR